NDLPDGHALREIQVNGPAPILHRKHADSNPDAQASNFPSASPLYTEERTDYTFLKNVSVR
ncbi:hypothetical protein, partial [Bifidobacterium sp. WCA-178-WT-4B]|uniref:hypothetical protein n=1 Tax=Bifidobacterium sp. WCA-178-WT-4B TaxID=2605776 RepID=UPI001E352E94